MAAGKALAGKAGRYCWINGSGAAFVLMRIGLLILMLLSTISQQPSTQRPDPIAIFDSNYSSMNLPFELSPKGKIYIYGQINGGKKLRILLDSGAATMLVIARRVADEQNLDLVEGYTVQGTGSQRSAAAVANDISVALSGIRLEHLHGYVLPFYQDIPGEHKDAVLGFSFFKNFVVEVDYGKKLLHVYDTRAFKYRGTGSIIPVQIENELGYVNARVRFRNESAPVDAKFNIDIGSGTAVYFYLRSVNKYKLLGKLEDPIRGASISHGGEIAMLFGKAQSIELGPSTYLTPFVGLELEAGGALTSESAAGALGAEVFRQFKVIFDIPHGRLILEPNR